MISTNVIQDFVSAKRRMRAQVKRHRQHVQLPEAKTYLDSLGPAATRMEEDLDCMEPVKILGRAVVLSPVRLQWDRGQGLTEAPLGIWAGVVVNLTIASLRSNRSIQGMTEPFMVLDRNLSSAPTRPP